MAVTALTFVAAVLAALLAAALLSQPLQSRANIWLGLTFGVVAWLALLSGGFTLEWDSTAYVVLNDLMPELLVPVGLIMYFAVLLDDGLARGRFWFVLLSPFVATTVVNLVADGNAELDLYLLPAWVTQSALETYYVVEEALTIVYALILGFATTALLRRHRGHVAYPWARRLWPWLAGTILVWALTYLAAQWVESELLGVVWAVVLVLLCVVVYDGILGLRLLQDRHAIALLRSRGTLSLKPQDAPVETPEAYVPDVAEAVTTSPAAPATADAADVAIAVAVSAEAAAPNPHLAVVDRLLAEEHRYRDPDLSRERLAEEVEISGSHLSRLLAQAGRPTFSQLVTEHRVGAVKAMLRDLEMAHFSIVAIGLECGFRSKSSFNQAFKADVGQTPSAYRRG